MRGEDRDTASMFSYVSPERRVPKDHPLRPIREMVDAALKELSPRFEAIYSRVGRPSIPPEKLLRALLLQVFYTIRSERLLMEQLDYTLLFRWFVGLEMDDAVWDPTVFTKNRQRLLDGEIAEEFFDKVLSQARAKKLLSDEHFSVDGTLIEAWASQKSFRPKDGKSSRPRRSGGTL
jgi:transposase